MPEKVYAVIWPLLEISSLNYSIQITDVKLLHKIIKPSVEMKKKHESLLNSGVYGMIPFTQTELTHRLIVPGSETYELPSICSHNATIPRKFFVMLLDHDNYNAGPALSPFEFKHFGLRDIIFKWNTKHFPYERYKMDWGKKTGLLEPYHHFLEAIGIKNGNVSNGITLENFINFFPMFVFDRAPDSCNGAHTHIPETGNIDIEFQFNKAPTKTIIALIYQQYDKIVTWNRIPGKVEFPPAVSVVPNFAVTKNPTEEAVNY